MHLLSTSCGVSGRLGWSSTSTHTATVRGGPSNGGTSQATASTERNRARAGIPSIVQRSARAGLKETPCTSVRKRWPSGTRGGSALLVVGSPVP
eukprot:6213681-Pleurochrysis_carterae.AAC.3